MPQYTYKCEKCDLQFDLKCLISQYKSQLLCPICGKICDRDFSNDSPVISNPKTLGSLADKNAGKMSNDHKQHLHLKTRNKKPD